MRFFAPDIGHVGEKRQTLPHFLSVRNVEHRRQQNGTDSRAKQNG